MAHTATIISANGSGISVADVKAVLGVNSNDIGTLCTSEQINKWAIYKPLRISKNGHLTEAERQSAMHGLTPCYIASATSEAATMIANTQKSLPTLSKWTYTKTIPASYGARLNDFLNSSDRTQPGYNHNAKPPMSGFKNITLFRSEFGSADVYYSFNFKWGRSTNQGDNTVSDIEIPLLELRSDICDGTWRLALLVYFPTTGGYKVAIASSHSAIPQTIGSNPQEILIRHAETGYLSKLYEEAWTAGTKELDAIPILARNISRGGSGNEDMWRCQESTLFMSMPLADTIKIRLSDSFAIDSFTFNYIIIKYLTQSGSVAVSYTLYPVGGSGQSVTQLADPANYNAVRCQIELNFTISGTMASNVSVTKSSIRLGIENTFINSIVTSLKDSSGNEISKLPALSGTYTALATDPQLTDGSMSDIMKILANFPRNIGLPQVNNRQVHPSITLSSTSRFNTSNYFFHRYQ